MTPVETKLRELIAAARRDGRSLNWITRRAGVPYYATYLWLTGRTATITVGNADKLMQALTGEGLR